MEPQRMTTPEGREIALHQRKGAGTGVIFLGGFRSDMTGTKAQHLQAWAEAAGRPFLRFDYGGHGASGGDFLSLGIADWLADATAALSLTEGPQVLVGSSMGGWLALLLARAMPERVAGLVGVAAAPDFTEDLMWALFSEEQRGEVMEKGVTYEPSDYGDPYPITRTLIEQGRQHLVLRAPLVLNCPVRLLQGTADLDVPQAVALRLLDHITGGDVRLTLVRGADHRFSTEPCLAMMVAAVEDALTGAG